MITSGLGNGFYFWLFCCCCYVVPSLFPSEGPSGEANESNEEKNHYKSLNFTCSTGNELCHWVEPEHRRLQSSPQQ